MASLTPSCESCRCLGLLRQIEVGSCMDCSIQGQFTFFSLHTIWPQQINLDHLGENRIQTFELTNIVMNFHCCHPSYFSFLSLVFYKYVKCKLLILMKFKDFIIVIKTILFYMCVCVQHSGLMIRG